MMEWVREILCLSSVSDLLRPIVRALVHITHILFGSSCSGRERNRD